MGDFRDDIMTGLTPTPPLDENECAGIKRILADDLEMQSQRHSERARHLAGEDLATVNRILAHIQRALDSVVGEPLSRSAMRDYAQITVKMRIWKMLDGDVASGRLVVCAIDGKQDVLLDELVAWADDRKITVEQDTLPGCPPLVAASYQRLHQKWSGVTQNARSNETMDMTALQVDLAAEDASTEPPSKMPQASCTAAQIGDGDESKTPNKRGAPVSRAAAQDASILAAVVSRGLDPMMLPKGEPGKRTVKADIRVDLTSNRKDIFHSARTFNTAWQRLRDRNDILEE